MSARAPLGCRFDELRRRWVALETVQQIPVYVLVLGRGAERVVSVMESLQATVDELDRGRDAPIETQWELLTRAALGHDATVACRAGTRGDDEPGLQYALFGNEQQQHCCVRDDTVTLFCDVEGGFQPTTARATWAMTSATDRTATAPAAETETHEPETTPMPPPRRRPGRPTWKPVPTRRASPSTSPAPRSAVAGRPPPDWNCVIEATGTVTDAGAVDWRDDWSTETGEVGRTLQLQGFIDAVRIDPDRYQAADHGPPPLSGSADDVLRSGPHPRVRVSGRYIFWRCNVIARADESHELDRLWNTFKRDIPSLSEAW